VEGGDAPVTVQDVAEATGLTEAEVIAQVRQIRAETAFAEPKAAPAPSPLPWIALGALVVAVGVTGWRISLGDGMPSFKPEPRGDVPFAPAAPAPVRRELATMSLAMTNISNISQRPPSGFDVHVLGQRNDYSSGSSYDPETIALPYGQVLKGLAESAAEVAAAMDEAEKHPRFPLPPPSANGRYRDSQGNVYTPRPGFARVVMSGWAGTEAGWVQLPLTAEGRKALDDLAQRLLKDAKKEQDDALAPVSDPRAGLVVPPPGFAFRFAGRRLDFQQGPRISFAGIPRPAVADRVTAALLNAVHRDRRPPIGPWTGDAGKDAKIPIPSLSHVEILGPENLVTGDIPTRVGEEAATRKAIEALAGKVAEQIDAINHKAAEYNGNRRP